MNMDFLPSDLEHMNTNFLDMIENDANSQLLDIDNLNSEKLNDFLNGDLLDTSQTSQMDFEKEDLSNSNWFQNELNLQWSDISRVPQSLIDASSEIENNNPNLLVNPQSVLPMHSTHQTVQNNSQQINPVNVRNGIAVKINGQDAVLTPTQHPQIQYVTVQNVNNSQLGYTVQPITICQQQIRNIQTITSPSVNSPVLVEHLQNGVHNSQTHLNNNRIGVQNKKPEKVYPKPVYSYSCLIAMALKNSKTGNLPVSEIYNFMIDNFPYFKTAPDGWKNSVRHNLSLNKCFAKVDTGKPPGAHTRKGCLWALNPAKIEKMEEEIIKWRKKDPESVKLSMSKPENLELIEQGKAGPPRSDSDEPATPIKQEPQTPVTPVKRSVQSQVCQTPLQPLVVQREVAVMVKTDPDLNSTEVKEVNAFDPALNDLALQNALWDEELTIGVGNPSHQSSMCPSPLTTHSTIGTQFHGNITYTTSPLVTHSPLRNSTPTKVFQQTPTKIYPQTPSRVILA